MDSTSTTDDAPVTRARPREWFGLGLLAVPCMLISVNSNLLNLAMPMLAADLRPSTTQLLWISDIYVFLVAGLLLPMGLLADRFGRRRLLLIGAAVFGAASVGAGLSSSPTGLMLCRALLGVGGAMLGPSTLSLIRSMFADAAQRAVALGIWTASFAVGGIVGPLVGGLLIETASWRAVFAVTPPAMLLLLVLGPFFLPEYRSGRTRRVDVLGVLLAIGGLLSTTYAIKQLSAAAAPHVPTVAGVVGVGLLAGFLRRQARVREPVLDLSLFKDRAYTVPLAGNALAFAVLYGSQLLLAQHLQAVLGMSPLQAGLWTIPSACAYAVGGLLAPRLTTRLGVPRLLATGLAVTAAGFAILAATGPGLGLLAFLLGTVVSALGLAPVYQLTTDATVAAVPASRAGVAGATLETITNLGGALGIALFGSLAGAVYRTGTAATGNDTQTIGDALAQAPGLPPAEAADLVQAAQQAFTAGFQLVSIMGAAVLLFAAVATLLLLRQPGAPEAANSRAGRPDGAPEGGPVVG
ncbi:MAG TPA: MFS transporter [Propionibacteriaceae bacterium]